MAPNEISNKLISEGLLGIKERGEIEDTFDMIILIEAARRVLLIDGMIKRPTVEVVETESFDPRDRYQTELNGHCVGIHGTKDNAELQASCYRMYLGMEGSEG